MRIEIIGNAAIFGLMMYWSDWPMIGFVLWLIALVYWIVGMVLEQET